MIHIVWVRESEKRLFERLYRYHDSSAHELVQVINGAANSSESPTQICVPFNFWYSYKGQFCSYLILQCTKCKSITNQARKPRNYASSKLLPSDRLTHQVRV